jgi:inner membrane protein
MDTITHALTGALIGTAARGRAGKAGLACALTASVAPDLDMPVRFFGSAAYLEFHRVVLNSLLVAPVLALAVAFGVRWRYRNSDLRLIVAIALACVGLHVFMDYTNSYGFVPFWPFSGKWHALDIVFIVDPWITGTLVAGLVAMRFTPRKTLVLAVCMAVLVSYWGGRMYLHGWAKRSFEKQYPDAFSVGAFPAPVNPFRWRMVAQARDAYWAGWYNIVDGEWDGLEMYPRTPSDEITKKARQAPVVRMFLKFARYPLVTYEKSGDDWLVRFRDMRFSFSEGHSGFVATAVVRPDGTVSRGEFSFR